VVVLSLLLLGLSACSGTTFVYNQLDSILPWYIDDYVDLDRVQERQLDKTLQPFLSWHRQQELPRYVELLDQVEAGLGRPLTAADVGAIYSGAEVAWQRLEQESLDWLLELGGTLSDAQVQDFLAYLQDKQEEYEDKYLTRSEPEYREETYDSFVESVTDYLGSLTPGQRERLRLASAALERSDEVWLQERVAWLKRLAVMLQREPGWEQRVREAVAQRAETVSPRYQQVYQHNLEVIFEAVADVLNSRTEKQDRRLQTELAGLRGDLQTLIAQGVTAPAEAG
jgi:hypothetical protein